MAYMVDRDAPYSGLASIMAMNGRYGDTELVHMSKPEIRGLASLGELTINPETGLPEAFNLKSLLPVIGGIAGSFLLPGIGTALGTSLFSGIGGGMIASGLGTFAGGILGGQNFGEAALGGLMGGITSGAMKGLSGLMSGAGAAGADVAGAAVTDAVADTAVSTAATEGAELVSMGIEGGTLIPSVSDGVSAAYPAPTVPSSGFFDWMSDNPGKTALGVGGLGVAGLLAGGDEQYPEEEPKETKPFPRFKALGGNVKPEDLNLSEKEILRRNIEGFKDTEDAQYFTPLTYELRPSELNTGGLVGLDDNQGSSQSSGVANFLQPKQGNNNVDPEKDIFNSMYNFGASAGKADEEKGVQSLVSPVDVVSPPENTGRLRLELLGGGKHRYVRDAPPLVVEEPAEIIPVPDTIEELSDNDDEDEGPSNAGGDDTGGVGEGPNGSEGPPAATGGLISMLKKADGGIVSLAEGKRPRPKSKPNSKLINKLTKYLMDEEDFRSETYIPTKDDKPTIGFGHTGKYAKKGAKITRKKAKEILSEDIKIRMPELESKIEDFNSLPLKLQTALAGEYFRGSVGQSPKTIDYINQGKYGEASKEFLINEEYLNAEDNNRAGIMPRMEAVSNELNELQNYLDRGVMQYPRTAKDTSYKGGIEGLEGGSFLEKIREYIPFSEGGTLEQYYQGQVIGKGDGMSDEILFDVEGRNPDMALLSRDEYVIPADVVSMIGNGSSNAGAEELDGFLKNVRQQSFGTRKQQREMTNPQKGLSALV
tara:strand:+ start:339 stop:2630 length:2292 start_codon:yes stop_codon:yes gene_type:complete